MINCDIFLLLFIILSVYLVQFVDSWRGWKISSRQCVEQYRELKFVKSAKEKHDIAFKIFNAKHDKATSYISAPTFLRSRDFVEFVDKGKLQIGSAIGKGGTASNIVVRQLNNVTLTIDCGQIVSIWGAFPNDDELVWAEVVRNATKLLNDMSDEDRSLKEFWKLCSQRSTAIPVDSTDLAIYLFQRQKFRRWLNPNLSGADCHVFIPTPVQRFVSAVILFDDVIHFKRRPSSCIQLDSASNDNCKIFRSREEVPPHVHVVKEGGYSICHESVVNTRSATMFAKYCRLMVCGGQNYNNSILSDYEVNKIIFELESFIAGSPCSGLITSLLSCMREPISIEGAKNILLALKKPGGTLHKAGTTDCTAWTNAAVQAAKQLSLKIGQHRLNIKDMALNSDTIPIHKHFPIAIDVEGTSLLDDAFSFSRDTNEILIHVSDVYKFLREEPVLLSAAKQRKRSISTSSGLSHVLPIVALKALSLSREDYNEVLTVALTIEFLSGQVQSRRVFHSIVGPVSTVNINTANEILVGFDHNIGGGQHGLSDNLNNDIRDMGLICEKLCEANPWLDYKYTNTKKMSSRSRNHHGSFRIINTLLTLYSYYVHEFCLNSGVATPVAWENRDGLDLKRVRRFGTSPLRSWMSILQQQQIRSALNGDRGLTRAECAAAVRFYASAKR